MAKRNEWVVRVVHMEEDRLCIRRHLGFWLEQLRYAGLVTYHVQGDMVPNGAKVRDTDEDYLVKDVFDLHAPKGVDNKVWAEQNAARMQSFGLLAVAAPAWSTVEHLR